MLDGVWRPSYEGRHTAFAPKVQTRWGRLPVKGSVPSARGA
jgi:hypothetical protein